MSAARARTTILVVMAALPGGAACGDDLPNDVIQLDGSSSSSTAGTDTSTTGEPTTSTTVAPASSDEGGSTSSSTGPSTVGIPDECTVSADCGGGELCVAPFDQAAGPEGKGAYACVSECVVNMDEDRWCADAAACCDALAECNDRGYCVDPEGSTGGSEGSGSSSGSTGGSTG